MLKHAIALCQVILLAGCIGKAQAGQDPTTPYRAMVKATLAGDFKGYKATLSTEMLKKYSEQEMRQMFQAQAKEFQKYGAETIGDFQFSTGNRDMLPKLTEGYAWVFYSHKESSHGSGGMVVKDGMEWKIVEISKQALKH